MAKNYWPHGIVASIIACVIACAATIIVSLDYPVEMDNFYFEKYQKIDDKINEILASQRKFEQNFSVEFKDANQNVKRPANLEIKVSPKTARASDLAYELMLTRPDTNEANLKLEGELSGGVLKTQKVNFTKPGRWQLLAKFTSADLNASAFYKFEIYADE